MDTYRYNTKYIPKEFWNIIEYGDTLRLRLLKDVTGCGATYGIMKKQYAGKRILVMPTIKLIQDKQRQADAGEFGSAKVISLHSDSIHTQGDITRSDIVLMTPDRLVLIYENSRELFDQINDSLLVIDEEHTFESAGSYREAFGKLDFVVATYWQGSIITISATAPFVVSPFFEGFDIIQLENPTRTKNKVQVLTQASMFHKLVDKFVASGEKLVIVTNDINMFRSLRARSSDIMTITGHSLRSKLMFEGFASGTSAANNQIIIISSSATEGIDFNIDAHVMIMCNYIIEAYIFSLQTMIQALGRPRGALLESIICINKPVNDKDKIHVPNAGASIKYVQDVIWKIKADDKLHPLQCVDKLNELDGCMEVGGEHVVNTQAICARTASAINYNIFHSQDYLRLMNEYAVTCNIEFIPIRKVSISFPNPVHRPKFSDILGVARGLDLRILREEAHIQRINIRGGTHYGTLSKNYIVANYMAQLLLEDTCGINETVCGKNTTLARSLKILNSICVCQNYVELDAEVADLVGLDLLRYNLKMAGQVCNWHVNPYSNNSSIAHLTTTRASTKGLSKNTIGQMKAKYNIDRIYFNQNQVDTIQLLWYFYHKNPRTAQIIDWHHGRKVMAKGMNKLEAKILRNTWIDLINEMMGLCVNHLTDMRQDVRSTRTYSAVTGLPLSLINELHPRDILEIDISSANPAFIDMIVGSNLHDEIYNRVMDFDNVERDEAKVRYNRLLNSTEEQWKYRSRITKAKQLQHWGYTKAQAKQIEDLSIYRGNMFYEMTSKESDVIEQLSDLLNIQDTDNLLTIRRHDSILVFGDIEEMEGVVRRIQRTKFGDFEVHIDINR